MLNKLARSWQLLLTSLQVVRQNRKLLLFPLVTAACTIVIALFFIAPVVLYPSGHALSDAAHWQVLGTRFGFLGEGGQAETRPNGFFYAYAAAIYLVSMFVATFANVAFYQQILHALNGQPVSIRAGVRFASTRLGSILVWSLFAGAIGLIIQALEERFGWIGRWVMKFVGVVWSVASVFAIPVIIREGGTNPFVLLRHSAGTLRRTWGEALIGYAGVSIGSGLVFVASLGLLGVAGALAAILNSWVLFALAAGIWILALFALSYVTAVAGHIYRCALFVYAAEGAIPAPYTADMMNAAWKMKKS